MQLKLLDNKLEAIVDSEDYDRVKDYRWRLMTQKRTGYDVTYVYVSQYVKGAPTRTIYLHRLIMDCPDGYVVDHINGNTLDNRKSNLRICTKSQNSKNWHNRIGHTY